jgi:hypothetical protein
VYTIAIISLSLSLVSIVEMEERSLEEVNTTRRLSGKELEDAIHEAVRGGDVKKMRELLETYGDVVTDRGFGERGDRALHVAAMNGYRDLVELLIQNGAEVNALDGRRHASLHMAAQEGHVDVAKLLIQNGAYLDIEDFNKSGSLHYAAFHGQIDVAKLLIHHGASVNVLDNDNVMALHCAASGGHVDIVKLLIQNGADVNAVTRDKESVLYMACCMSNSVPVTLELVCLGAKMDYNALKEDKTDLLNHIEWKIKKIRDCERATHMYSTEEGKFMWNLKFYLTWKYKAAAFRMYHTIRSFITFNGIFMASGFDLGKGSIWRKPHLLRE